MNPPLREASDLAALAGRTRRRDDRRDRDRPRAAPRRREGGRVRRRAVRSRRPRDGRVSVVYDRLVARGRLPLERVSSSSSRPDRRAPSASPAGRSRAGSPADVTLFDPEARWKVDPARFLSRGRSTPFAGWELTGRAGRHDRRRGTCVAAGRAVGASPERRARAALRRGRSSRSCIAPAAEDSRAARRASRCACPRGSRRPRRSSVSAERAKGRGIELQVAAEGTARPEGLRGRPPVDSSSLRDAAVARSRASRLSFEGGGFTFDGRTLCRRRTMRSSSPIRRARPRSSSSGAPTRSVLDARGRASPRPVRPRPADYAGGLGRPDEGGTLRRQADGRLAIDRATDRDRIAEREAFYKALAAREARERRVGAPRVGGARPPRAGRRRLRGTPASSRSSCASSPTPSRRLSTRAPRARGPRRARQDKIVVEIDASAPAEPDLVEPVLAAAATGAPPTRRCSSGGRSCSRTASRRVGTWWGRDVRGFAAFTHAAGVDPSLEDVVRGSDGRVAGPDGRRGRRVARRRARAWTARRAVEKALTEPEGNLGTKLVRWRETAWRQAVQPPTRRPLPEGLRARRRPIAMTNTVEERLRLRRPRSRRCGA